MTGTFNDLIDSLLAPENQAQGGETSINRTALGNRNKTPFKNQSAAGYPGNQSLILPKKLSFDFSLPAGDPTFSGLTESFSAAGLVNNRFINNSGTGWVGSMFDGDSDSSAFRRSATR